MPYIDKHTQSLQTLYPSRSQAWLDKKHEEFVSWLRRRLLGIKLGNQLDALAKGPSSTYLKYQGYEINGFTFYTKSKMERAHTKIVVFILMLTMKMTTCRRHTMVS